MPLIERNQITEAIAPAANGGALAGDIISMKEAAHCTVLVHITQGNAATVALTIEQAKDVSGTSAKALATAVPIYLVADAATSDAWVRQTDAVAYTTDDTVKHKLVAFEIPAEALDVANGFDCIQVKAGASNAANIVSAAYVVSGMRYGAGSVIAN